MTESAPALVLINVTRRCQLRRPKNMETQDRFFDNLTIKHFSEGTGGQSTRSTLFFPRPGQFRNLFLLHDTAQLYLTSFVQGADFTFILYIAFGKDF